MQNVTNALLNFILVSIPEELFIVAMTLIFMKRFDLLDIRMWKQNLKWIAIPVLPVALMINVFRYIIVIPNSLRSFICLTPMILLMIYIIIKNSFEINKKDIFLTIISIFISFAIVGLLEFLYVPILLNSVHLSLEYVNNHIFYNFIFSLPSRVVEFCLVLFILVKKNNTTKIYIFNTIVKNRFFTISFIFLLINTIILIVYMTKLVTIDNILNGLNSCDQLILTVIVISTPVILITTFLIFVNYLLLKEKQIQQTYENLIIQNDVLTDVEDK